MNRRDFLRLAPALGVAACPILNKVIAAESAPVAEVLRKATDAIDTGNKYHILSAYIFCDCGIGILLISSGDKPLLTVPAQAGKMMRVEASAGMMPRRYEGKLADLRIKQLQGSAPAVVLLRVVKDSHDCEMKSIWDYGAAVDRSEIVMLTTEGE